MRGRSAVLILFLFLGPVLAYAQGAAEPASSPKLTFIKAFKGSYPEYLHVVVNRDGEVTFRNGSIDRPDEPETFPVSSPFVGHLFALAGQLNYFRQIELEENKKVAHMGQKTFAFEQGGEETRVTFNYTRNRTALQLQELFEALARGRLLIRELEHHLMFDRLGLVEVVREFEREFNSRRLVEPQQFVPILRRIADDPRLIDLARSRARAILYRIEGGPSVLRFEHSDQETGWLYRVTLRAGQPALYEARPFAESADPLPLSFPPAAEKRLWELAELANYFRSYAEYQESDGRLRGYRLTFESGMEHNQVVFTKPPSAVLAEIVHIFQQALQQEYLRARLEEAVQSKSLMLQVVLQEVQAALREDRLISPEAFVPTLEGIARGEEQHAVVRGMAQQLLAQINQRNP